MQDAANYCGIPPETIISVVEFIAYAGFVFIG